MTDAELIAHFEKFGQGQVFAHLSKLSENQRQKLLQQAQSLAYQQTLEKIHQLYQNLVANSANSANKNSKAQNKIDFAKITPPPSVHIEGLPNADEARKLGEEAIAGGRVCAFTVAGGQGTRLSFDAPKGMFAISPIKQKTLFQIFAEKINFARRQFQQGRNNGIAWFIMTSEANHEETKKYFADNNYFDLPASDIFFFKQGILPAVDFDGKILLSSPDEIHMSPDGHGGSINALHRSGALAEMQKRGIDLISYFQVDNVLVNCLDPVFIGLHILNNCEVSTKAVRKTKPEEKVGVYANYEDKLHIVEYSDLPDELAQQKNSAGDGLQFNQGSIAIHLFRRDFLAKIAESKSEATDLPFHKAEKKVTYCDEAGKIIEPKSANAIKFESFIFDSFPMAENAKAVEVAREVEFSPLKNAEGDDSPATCLRHQTELYLSWLKKNGLRSDFAKVEISPLCASEEYYFCQKIKNLEKTDEFFSGNGGELYLENF